MVEAEQRVHEVLASLERHPSRRQAVDLVKDTARVRATARARVNVTLVFGIGLGLGFGPNRERVRLAAAAIGGAVEVQRDRVPRAELW